MCGPSPALVRPSVGVRSGEGTGCVAVLLPALVCRHVRGVKRPSAVFVRGYLQWPEDQGIHEGCCAFVVECVVHRSRKKNRAQRGKKKLWHGTEQTTYTSNTTGTRNVHRPHRTPQQHS